MSSNPVKRKKVATLANPSTGAGEGSCKKRRRNRITRSCLQCHASKRMCDRKRPCTRCAQHGITRFCVYEVDDPSKRLEAVDMTHLQKHVDKLKGVVREHKSKRCTRPPSDVHQEQQEHTSNVSASSPCHMECSSRTLQAGESKVDTLYPCPNTDDTVVVPHSTFNKPQSWEGSLALPSFEEIPVPRSPSFIDPFRVALSSSCDSPLDTPEIAHVTTPSLSAFGPILLGDDALASPFSYFTNDDPQSDIPIADPFDSTLCDITCGKGTRKASLTRCQPPLGVCECLSKAANYHAVLELSLRLRHTAEVLSRYPLHSKDSMCPLKQRIAELDAFTRFVTLPMRVVNILKYWIRSALLLGVSTGLE
ncbi:hypothetical protein BJV74DRAFT_547151 [Russula compacta]|nr:hypothetical protein BJV74DRAFT_547151 [Russula compacta]